MRLRDILIETTIDDLFRLVDNIIHDRDVSAGSPTVSRVERRPRGGGGCVLFSFGLCDSDDSEDQPPDEPGAGRQERVHEQQQDVVRHV